MFIQIIPDEPDDGEGVDEAVLLQDRLDPLVATQPQHVPMYRALLRTPMKEKR